MRFRTFQKIEPPSKVVEISIPDLFSLGLVMDILSNFVHFFSQISLEKPFSTICSLGTLGPSNDPNKHIHLYWLYSVKEIPH